MRKFGRIVLSILCLAIAAPSMAHADNLNLPYCPKIPKDPNKPLPPPPPPRPVLPAEPVMPAPAPSPVAPTPATYHRGSLWSKVASSERWTTAVLSVVQARRNDFEQARDIETFCPGYSRASQHQRDICWLRLVGAIAEFESAFKPAARPFCEGDGVYSVGLLALSTGECPNALTIPELQNPEANLICGLNRMAKLINRDHYIENSDNSGACAYWSTLRRPYQAKLPDGRTLNLGKRDQVIARTKSFNKF